MPTWFDSMSDVAIRVEGLGKQYRIGERERYYALRDLPSRILATLADRGRRNGAVQGPKEIWALKDVSFEVKRGEVVGVIGRNGAGKSTLLKILSRITVPTEGYVDVHGRVGSLLEVGTGFHPELTGRENVYFNGAVLGMKKVEIDRKFDEIVDFAEVEPFLDTPVKRYSTGMYMRLAFAVAAHLEPEILLVDEVLAVGDAQFQKKCLGKMGDQAAQGRTVLFISHNMGAVSRLCPRACWLEAGRLVTLGSTESIIAAYLSEHVDTETTGQHKWAEGFANQGTDEFKLFAVAVLDADGRVASNIDARREFVIQISYRVQKGLPYLRVGFLLTAADGTVLFETYDADNTELGGPRFSGDYVVECRIPGNLLQPGRYFITINAGMPNIKNLAFIEGAVSIQIEDTRSNGEALDTHRAGVIRPDLEWRLGTLAIA